MSGLLRAFEALVDYLGSIGWQALGLAVLCHLGKIVARTRAWRNILAAAHPEVEVRWRTVFGAYVSGVAVNGLLPARGGDLLKLYLVHRAIPGAAYPTLAATLLVETIFDLVVATLLLLWALERGVLPGLDVLPTLPAIDWLLLFQSPRLGLAVAVALLVAGFALGFWAAAHVKAFRERVAQGFAVLRTPRLYLRGVAGWQAVDWLLRVATVFFFLRAFGLDANLTNALLVQVTQSISTLLPLTPGGIGTEQALLVYVLSGAAPATALLSFSVGMKVVLVAANTVLGFAAIALMLRTLRWRELLHRRGAVEAPAGEDEEGGRREVEAPRRPS